MGRIRSKLGCAVDGHRWALVGGRCICLRCRRESGAIESRGRRARRPS